MLKINTAAIAALRDRLLQEGGAPSLIMTGPEAARQLGHPLAGDDRAKELFDATFEAMYLMLAADGQVASEEAEVLRGAMRELTAGVVRTKQIEALATECARTLDREGQKARLEAVAKVLRTDTTAAEAAFVLAAVTAMADEDVAEEENQTLNDFADLLELSEARANELLDQLEEAQKQ